MKTHYITILAIKEGGKLKLSDHGDTDVKSGDLVFWTIAPKSKVISISGISKTKGKNIFTKGPSKIKNSKVWFGIVKSKFKSKSEETYTIKYKSESGNGSHDPKISVKP